MTDAEFAKKAAAGFNKELDVPFIPEGQEGAWIEWAILKIAPVHGGVAGSCGWSMYSDRQRQWIGNL